MLCLTVRVIHKNSLLLNKHNGDDAPQDLSIRVLYVTSTYLINYGNYVSLVGVEDHN